MNSKKSESRTKPVESPDDFRKRVKAEGRRTYQTLFKERVPGWSGVPDVFQSISDLAPGLNKLSAAALAGNAGAQSVILELAAHCCEITSHVALYYEAEAAELARNRASWPVTLSYLPEIRSLTISRVNELPLAENLPVALPKKRKPFSVLNPQVKPNHEIWTRMVQLALSDHGKDLPAWDGSKSAEEAWFKAIWTLILKNGPVEKSHLRALGLATAREKIDTYPEGTRSFENGVVNGIRQSLRRAFKTIYLRKK
jgi:hypothetical protein